LNPRLKQLLQFILFASVGAIILYLLYQSQSTKYVEECLTLGKAQEDCSLLDKIIEDFQSANWYWILLILCIYMLSNVFRAWRWQMLLEPLGHKANFWNALMAIMIGYFANLGIPRLGEIMRAGIFAKYEHIGVEKVIGTVVTDRIIDVISLAVFLLVTAPFSYGPVSQYLRENLSLGQYLTGDWWLFPLLMIILVGAAIFTLLRSQSVRQSTIAKKLFSLISGFKDGALSVFSLASPGKFIVYTIGIWTCYYLMTYLTFYSFEPTSHLGPQEGLITFIFGTLGILFPSPGGMGTYHLMLMEALKIYSVSSIEGFSFANILYFSIQIFCNVLFGIFSLIFISIYNQGRHAAISR